MGWAVIEGVDADAREYLVAHPGGTRWRTRFDAIGRCDPVNWVHVACFGAVEANWDRAAAVRDSFADAGDLLEGTRASADMPAPPEQQRQGLAALEAWAADAARGVGACSWTEQSH